jgi:hypothetical protein
MIAPREKSTPDYESLLFSHKLFLNEMLQVGPIVIGDGFQKSKNGNPGINWGTM